MAAGTAEINQGRDFNHMALDHFVPQVHLRRFNSPVLGDRFYAVRKKDLRRFTPNSKGVCAINNGSTNVFLKDQRIIEEFLALVEPGYNNAVDNIGIEKIDNDSVMAIAGIFSTIMVCSPTGMRMQSGPLQAIVEAEMAILERNGAVPPPPEEAFGGKTLVELLREKTISVSVDPKYPQAIGISMILQLTENFGNARWDIIHNRFKDCPFFTSDFPLPIETSDDPRIVNKIFPLTPELAIRIRPDLSLERSKLDLTFKQFKFRSVEPSRQDIIEINRRLVQCAEELIFFRDDLPWVMDFVEKNSGYWIDMISQRVSIPRGSFVISSQRIVRRPVG